MRVFLLLALTSFLVQGASIQKPPVKVPIENKPPKGESSSEEEPEFDGEWECGGEDLSKLISYQMIAKDCPKLLSKFFSPVYLTISHVLDTVNNCCIHHDQCYEDQLGQANCDKIFCACLDVSFPFKHVNIHILESHVLAQKRKQGLLRRAQPLLLRNG